MVEAPIRFEVIGQGDLGAELHAWGPWLPGSTTTVSQQSGTDTGAALVWRVDFPAGPEFASGALQRELSSSRSLEAQSATVLPRLQALLQMEQRKPHGGVSFGFEGGASGAGSSASRPALPGPERELWASLTEAQAMTSVSFGVSSANDEEVARSGLVQMLTAPLLQLSRHAQIETRLEGRCIGRTTVSLSGDFLSSFAGELSAEEQAVHQRSVAFVLQSRRVWIRSLLLVLNCALMLARATTNPLSAARLVWMAAKYVRSVMGEARLTA